MSVSMKHLEDLGVDLEELARGWAGLGMDRIDLCHGRDIWRAAVNAVMNFGYHKMRGIS